MEYAEQGAATYNAAFAENADIDSARQPGTALTNLKMLKEFIRLLFIAATPYLTIAKYASPRRKG